MTCEKMGTYVAGTGEERQGNEEGRDWAMAITAKRALEGDP